MEFLYKNANENRNARTQLKICHYPGTTATLDQDELMYSMIKYGRLMRRMFMDQIGTHYTSDEYDIYFQMMQNIYHCMSITKWCCTEFRLSGMMQTNYHPWPIFWIAVLKNFIIERQQFDRTALLFRIRGWKIINL